MLKITILATTLGLASLFALQFHGPSAGADAGASRVDDHAAMEKCMKEMKSAMRKLRKSIEDKSQKTKSLEYVAQLQKNIVEVKAMTPGVVQKSEKKDEMAAKYRGQMLDCLEQTIALERAVMAENVEDAQKALKALHELQDSGHSTFKVDDH